MAKKKKKDDALLNYLRAIIQALAGELLESTRGHSYFLVTKERKGFAPEAVSVYDRFEEAEDFADQWNGHPSTPSNMEYNVVEVVEKPMIDDRIEIALKHDGENKAKTTMKISGIRKPEPSGFEPKQLTTA